MQTQRKLHKKGELSDDRVERLDRLEFTWSANTSWGERFNELKSYKRKHRNCDVPKNYSPNPQLGQWVQTQRSFHKRGELSDDRIERLEELGFQWVVGRGGVFNTQKWNNRFNDLKSYQRKHGNCDVPQNYPHNPQLGVWVQTQRKTHKKGELSEDRIVRLNQLGFQWVVVRRGRLRGSGCMGEEFEDNGKVRRQQVRSTKAGGMTKSRSSKPSSLSSSKKRKRGQQTALDVEGDEGDERLSNPPQKKTATQRPGCSVNGCRNPIAGCPKFSKMGVCWFHGENKPNLSTRK